MLQLVGHQLWRSPHLDFVLLLPENLELRQDLSRTPFDAEAGFSGTIFAFADRGSFVPLMDSLWPLNDINNLRCAMKNQVLALIPARGGSKGLKNKNIRELCGKPLVAYAIETALKAASVDRVVVSTDDPDIAELAVRYGAEVPFLRPKELAQDDSLVSEAIRHALGELEEQGYVPDALLTLYPTHIFRSVNLINTLVGKLIMGYSPVLTVKRVSFPPRGHFWLDPESGAAHPLLTEEESERIQAQCFCRPYGLFVGELLPRRPAKAYVHMVDDRIELVDIDYLSDMLFAENVIRHGLFDFGLS